MKTHLQLKPAPKRQVRKEDGSLMPVDGCKVPNTSYYRRRVTDGDLITANLSKPAKAAKGDS